MLKDWSNRRSECISLYKTFMKEKLIVGISQINGFRSRRLDVTLTPNIRSPRLGDCLTPNTRLDRIGDSFVSNWR
jgi:hypothetical protein